jgi:hypothetical protein
MWCLACMIPFVMGYLPKKRVRKRASKKEEGEQ